MKELKGIGFFENLFKNPKNELVEKALSEGKTAVGYNCYVVPEVLLNAGNTFGLWMTAPDVTSTIQADFYLSAVACTYCKALLQAGMDGTYEFMGATVFAPTCDHIRRSGQHFGLQNVNSDNPKYFNYMVDSPGKKTVGTVEWFAKDLRVLADKLNEAYDTNINDETVKKSIKEFNEFNSLMKSIGDFRKGENPRITGAEWHKIYGASKIAPKYLLIEPLKKIKAEIEAREIEENKAIKMMVVGSTFDKYEFIELIEAQGAIVVADRYCFGSLPGMEPVKEDGDPFINIAEYYLDTCQCPRMMENGPKRIEYSKELIKEYDVEGIIFQQMTFCDLWNYEGISVSRAMKKFDMPYVNISREFTITGEGQIRTRVQAFVESIKSKRELELLKK